MPERDKHPDAATAAKLCLLTALIACTVIRSGRHDHAINVSPALPPQARPDTRVAAPHLDLALIIQPNFRRPVQQSLLESDAPTPLFRPPEVRHFQQNLRSVPQA